jgi:hypothetical protein
MNHWDAPMEKRAEQKAKTHEREMPSAANTTRPKAHEDRLWMVSDLVGVGRDYFASGTSAKCLVWPVADRLLDEFD